MFRQIAGFELRYQVRSALFWVTVLIFAVLTFGSIASDNVRISGIDGNVKRNSPFAVAVTLQVMALFGVFIMAAFGIVMTRWQAVHLLPMPAFYNSVSMHGLIMLVFWILFFEMAGLIFGSTILLSARMVWPGLGWLTYGLMLVGSLIALRVLPAIAASPELSGWWLVPGVIGLGFAVLLWLAAQARMRGLDAALLDDRPDRLPGAGLLVALTLFVMGCAAVSAALTLLALWS